MHRFKEQRNLVTTFYYFAKIYLIRVVFRILIQLTHDEGDKDPYSWPQF